MRPTTWQPNCFITNSIYYYKWSSIAHKVINGLAYRSHTNGTTNASHGVWEISSAVAYDVRSTSHFSIWMLNWNEEWLLGECSRDTANGIAFSATPPLINLFTAYLDLHMFSSGFLFSRLSSPEKRVHFNRKCAGPSSVRSFSFPFRIEFSRCLRIILCTKCLVLQTSYTSWTIKSPIQRHQTRSSTRKNKNKNQTANENKRFH